MRLCVDATPLLLRSAGIKNYLYHWLHALQRRAAPDDHITAYPRLGTLAPLDHERSLVGRFGTAARIAAVLADTRLGIPVNELLIGNVDFFHASNQVRRPPRGVRLLATVYDMTCFVMPEMHTTANVQAETEFFERIGRRAAGLVAISEYSRQDAIRVLKLPPERIRTIYPGVAESLFTVTDAEADAVRQRYHLTRPYGLFLGTVEPRKNVDVMLDAYEGLHADLRESFDLVLAGPLGWANPATAQRVAARRNATSAVRYLGYVPEPDLAALTKGALVFVYPSLYEGFGLPLAQAMAAGVPSITSNQSCLPEVAGDGALIVDPRSPTELRSALARLIESEPLRQSLSTAARTRATLYHWDRSAQASLDFFRSL